MDTIKKQNILNECNSLDMSALCALIENGSITIHELQEAGLDDEKVNELINLYKKEEELAKAKVEAEVNKSKLNSEKENLLDKITHNKVTVDQFVHEFTSGKITVNDLLNIGISQKTINSIKYYGQDRGVTIFKRIEDLPAIAPNRTDVYFVGIAGTGKSTMLSGLLNAAHKDGILIPDTYNNEGSKYQNQVIEDLRRGVLPKATAKGSFNYIALSLADNDNKAHPLNVVEVPGELYSKIYENQENVDSLLTYIQNENKKILIFTIDSFAQHHGFDENGESVPDQSLIYTNILNIFQKRGVLEQTDAIYLIVNKFDAIKELRYSNDDRSDAELSLDFLNEEFKSLLNNCKAARTRKNEFKIKVLPFSIGDISYKFILNKYNINYSRELINNILDDSFIVTKKKFELF